jgi:hypothetical protein
VSKESDRASSAKRCRAGANTPIEVPDDIFERVSTLCQALPAITERSTAHSFEVRRKSFCLLVAVAGPTGELVTMLVLRADADERDALLSIGRPFFTPPGVRGRIGVLLTKDTDWEEIRELVTDSYRRAAPKKLAAFLD